MKENYNRVFYFFNKFYLFFILFGFLLTNNQLLYAQLPTDFVKVDLKTGLANATNFQFAPDGRIFILDRFGEVLIYKPDLQLTVSAGTLPVFHELEDGLLGIAFDPNFETNNYIYLHYSPLNSIKNRVSRFTMNGDVLGPETMILEWDVLRTAGTNHSGGDMVFDSQGNLLIATGDNTQHSAYAPLNESQANKSAEKSSSNANDLRGKILRITPQPDGSYTVPAGNLFPGGVGGLPEIYVMGARNPYRISVDAQTDWLYWGEVGPDANSASSSGPEGLDEINLTKNAENAGWPYFSGKDNDPYLVTTENPDEYYDPLSPKNNSVWNTGGTNLPEATPAWMEFFHKCYLAGPRYYFDTNQTDQQKLPIEFDGLLFIYDFNSSRIWTVKMDANGNIIDFNFNSPWAPNVFNELKDGFIDMKIGPDGKMYILAYGEGCCPDNVGSGKLIRIDYTGITTNSPPVVVLDTDVTNGALPLTVSFSSVGTTDPNGDTPLTYSWDFNSDGTPDSTDPNPTFVYTTAGTFNAQLKVDDGNGGIGVKNVTIYAGNTSAQFTYNYPPDGGLVGWGDDLNLDIDVTDAEDGSTADNTIDCNNVNVIPSLGHLNHFHDDLTVSACPQTIFLGYEGHDIYGEMDIYYVFGANYTDSGGLTSFDQIQLHPKRKEAEYYATQSGTKIIPNTNPFEGGSEAIRVDNNGYISYSGRNLLNINAVKYNVASTNAGGTIEFRTGSPSGPIIATTSVPNTGSLNDWLEVETSFTDPGGKNDLFFVFKNGSTSQAIFDLNFVEFIGNGVSIDTSAPEVLTVKTIGTTTVAVEFSEYVSKATAENLANYQIANGVTISAAVLQNNSRTVWLTTSTLASGTNYNLTISNVQNTSGIPIASGSYPFLVFSEVRINSGGPQTTLNGSNFIADQYSIGGTLFTNVVPIAGTDDDAMYQTERFATGSGNFSYEIPVGIAGEYDIRLHFAEIFFGLSGGGASGGVGSRVFNVTIEGNPVLTNFDILSEVAPATALVKEFNNITITDGFASIQFSDVVQSSKVNGIEVLPPDAFDGELNANITITSPSNGWDVNQPFEVAFRVENWTVLEGDTHLHYYIDDVMVGPYYSYEPISIDGLGQGQRTIKLELFNANHTATGILDEVTVNVTGSITCNETPFPDQWGIKQLETTSLPHRSVYTFADYDLDGDGLKDIVTGGWWYKNPGSISGTWQRSDIGNLFDNVVHVYDFDNDNDLDLLGVTSDQQSPVGYTGSQLVWAQNDGSGNFTIYTNIPAGDTNYSEPFLAGLAGGIFSIGGSYQMAINWNGAEQTGSPMQMLTPTTDPTTGIWSLVDIAGATSTGEDLQAGDIDQDNDLDLFQGSNWVRNSGGTWSTHSTGITYPTTPDRAQLADFNRDGRLDAVVGQLSLPSSDPEFSQFAWFEAPAGLGANPDQTWVRNVLATDINGSLSVFATDIDFDGDKDIVVGEWRGQHRLIAFENNLCDDGTFTTQIINAGGASATLEHHDGARVTDLDNDGDLDIISNGWAQNFPRIYENQTVPVGADEPVVNAGEDQAVLLGGTITLNGSANDPDGGTIASYLWTQVSGPNTATLSGVTTADLSVNGLIGGTYVFRLTATDDENDIGFDEVTVTVERAPATFFINSGGPSYNFNGTDWPADNSFVGGSTFENAVPIANTENDQLYQTERFDSSGTLLYEIPIANGTYNLDLHFAELFYGVGSQAGGVGSRIFNITVENGQGQVDNYDIVAAAGGSATAVIESFKGISVTDDNLTITLTAVTEFPKISGIAIFETRPPTVDAGLDQSVTLPTDSAVFNGTASDPDGGAIAMYQWAQVSGPNTATLTGTDTADLTVNALVEGTYVFRLTVTDDEGETAFDELSITVAAEGTPFAVAEATPISGSAPLLVTFTGSNSTDNTSIASYIWDFGNGMTSTEADTEHTYTVPGTYSVVLTVTDDGGLTDTDTLTIIVSENPGAEMRIILQSNPPDRADGGFANVQVIKQPTHTRVMNISLYDVGGRYLDGYLPEEIEKNGVYQVPIATLRDGIYYIRVAMNQGKTTLIKLWVRN